MKILHSDNSFTGKLTFGFYRFGVYSLDHAINSGLDLEMPGTNKWRTLDLMNRSIQSRKIMQRTVKERARKTIELVQKCARGAPEVRRLLSYHVAEAFQLTSMYRFLMAMA